ncbi:MAG: NUDIX domain-containing protein [Chloroflexota bacterium]
MNISGPDQLADWLNNNGIDTSHWGIGNAKSLNDLWHEILVGESHFQSHSLLRRVEVSSVRIIQRVVYSRDPSIESKDWQLIEAVQIFHDGRKRFPNRNPSEKMKRGETPEEAAWRCLYEEVGCTETDVINSPKLIHTEERRLESPSYPGLESLFTMHLLECRVQGLPEHEFQTVNQAGHDPVATIQWRWEELAYNQ